MNHDIRIMAEWESAESVLMALPAPHTDWVYILDKAIDQYVRIIKTFTDAGQHVTLLVDNSPKASKLFADINPTLLTLIEAPYNDTWTRDYGPISVIRHDRLRALDFAFNGWGLKFAADRDNLVNLFLNREGVFNEGVYRNHRGFELEGGSIDTDGEGVILTTSKCLTSPNRNGGLKKHQLNDILERNLGASHVLWLDYGALEGDDTDSHIDTLARMAPENTILFTGCRNIDDSHFEELLKMRAQLTMLRNPDGEPYNLVELPMPDPIYDDDGRRLPATYANYLVTPTHIFVPAYSQPANDLLAAQCIKVAFPDHEVISIECTTLLWQHGSLHCATMQIPKGMFKDNI